MRPKTRTSPTIDALSRSKRRHDDTTLTVELAGLAVVVDAVEKLEPRGMIAGHCREPLFDVEPDRHRVNADAIRPSRW